MLEKNRQIVKIRKISLKYKKISFIVKIHKISLKYKKISLYFIHFSLKFSHMINILLKISSIL